jgi:hypothetical protein
MTSLLQRIVELIVLKESLVKTQNTSTGQIISVYSYLFDGE